MKHICIEGCVGIGKTTVATQLASMINEANILLEDFSHHPFLDDFYIDERYTFETEINFILIHYHQVYKIMNERPCILVSDYFFDRDKLFADANILSIQELEIFMKLYNLLRERLVQPDVIVCLTGTTDMIYDRILTRNRDVEKSITYDYIKKINEHYASFFDEIRKKFCTIDINMDENDFVKNPMLINQLYQRLIELQVI